MTEELYSLALIRRTLTEIADGIRPARVPDRSTDESLDPGMVLIHHVDVREAFSRLPDLYKRAIRIELEHTNDLDAMALELGTEPQEFKVIIEAAYNTLHGILNDN